MLQNNSLINKYISVKKNDTKHIFQRRPSLYGTLMIIKISISTIKDGIDSTFEQAFDQDQIVIASMLDYIAQHEYYFREKI